VPAAAHRDRGVPGPHGAPGQGVVPEPTHEVQAADTGNGRC